MSVTTSADMLAMDNGAWRREPIVVEHLPLEAYPLYIRWYAEIADAADLIGNQWEAEYARGMVAKFSTGGVQP